MHPAIFTNLNEDRGDAQRICIEEEDDSAVDYSLSAGSQGKNVRKKRWAVLVAVGARLAQVLLLLNLIVLTFLLFVGSSLQGESEVSCSSRAVEQILMPLNVLLGLLGLCLPRGGESPWSSPRSKLGLEHTIKVSECDYVVPGSERTPTYDAAASDASAIECRDVNCEEQGEPESPRLQGSGTITPVEDLMHELMQVALSLCSAAPTECRGLLAHCSYEERQAVHLLGQMVRNHLFPEADGIEEQNASPDQPELEPNKTIGSGLLSGFNMSIASDGASRSEASGAHNHRWNMLNDAVDQFLFGTSSGTDQVNGNSPTLASHAGIQMPHQPTADEDREETPESRPKTVDSDRPSQPTLTPPLIMTGPTASPTGDSASGGDCQSPREMSDEENAESPRSPFSVPEVSLTIAPCVDPPGSMPVPTTGLGTNGEIQLQGKDEAEVPQSSRQVSNPQGTKLIRRNSNRSVESNRDKRRMSGQSAASRIDSRRSSVSSANSQFSATSFTDFNRRQSYRNGSESAKMRPPLPGRRGSSDSQKHRKDKVDKSRYSTNESVRSKKSHKDKSRYNTGGSSHPSEVVRGLMKSVAALPTEEIGGVSWGRDGCAARCSEMESERLASINLANRYRDRTGSMDRTSRRQSCEIQDPDDRQGRRSHTVGYSSNVEQELRDACQAVFPNSPRSQAASRRASTISLQQGVEGLRSSVSQKYTSTAGSQALAIPICGSHAGSRRGSVTLSVAVASNAVGSRRASRVSIASLVQPDSPTINRRLSVSQVSHVSHASNASPRRLSNSLALCHVPSLGSKNSSAHTGTYEGDGSSNANWVASGSVSSCTDRTSRRRRGQGSDSFRFTSVSTRLRESLKKMTGRGDKSKRTSSTGALSRLKRWGLPKYVQQLFVDYELRTQEIQWRQVLGVKSVDELAAEVEAGLCRIVPFAEEQVMRVVQVCALRIAASPDSDGNGSVKNELVLIQKWHHSRKGGWFRKNALPSTKLRGQEEPREAALRMLEDEFGDFLGSLQIQDDAPLEELVQEKESTSYPGLLTQYRTTIVEVRINPDADFKALADLGLGPDCPDHLQGSILTDTETGETSYDWMQTKHCRIQGIPVAGVKDYTTLEVLKEDDDSDDDDENEVGSGPDRGELIRLLQEAAASDSCPSLKDMVRERGEILELSLEEIAKGLYREDDPMNNADSSPPRSPSNAQRFQTCPCTPSGSMTTELRPETPMSSVGPLASDNALPKKGSLFQILALMQGGRQGFNSEMPPDIESLEERRRSWGEKSYAMSENTVSTAMLWKMAMQDYDYDRQMASGAGSLKSSPPPALDMLENRPQMSRMTPPEALLSHLCEQLEGMDVSKERSRLWQRESNSRSVTPPERETQLRADELDHKQAPCEVHQEAPAAAVALPAVADRPVEAASSSGQISTTTGSNGSAETTVSAQRDAEDAESQEERSRKYAERKARLKAQKAQPGKVNYGEILRNGYEQFPNFSDQTEQAKSSACAEDALAVAASAPEREEATSPAATSSLGHPDFGGSEMSAATSTTQGSEGSGESQEEKARRYADRKARLKARKSDNRPGKVNYGEILRNGYEQFPNQSAQANPDAKADAVGNVTEQGGASASGAAPTSTAPGTEHTQSAGGMGSSGSQESPKEDTKARAANYGGLGQEGYWEVIRKLVAAGSQSPSPEPEEKPEKPMTQEEKMKQWRERKERRKSQEKTKKRPSYGSLLKKESSPVISPRTSPTPSDEPQAGSELPGTQSSMKINVVGASEPCRGSTTIFGGRQSIGSQNLGFQFSAGLVHANGRLSLPKTALEPIPSPPGSRRASELERDEEDEDNGSRRSLVADSLSSPDSGCNDGEVDQLVDQQNDHEGCDEDEQVAQDVSSTQRSPLPSEPASPRYSREQRSTDTLEQAMKGLGV